MDNIVPFPEYIPVVEDYMKSLPPNLDEGTIDVYIRILRQFTDWLAEQPGSGGRFQPDFMTTNALQTYINQLDEERYSISHRNRVKTVVGAFAKWIIEERGLRIKNPAKGIVIPPQPQLAPRMLSPDQRYVLKNIIEREGDDRSAAIFALGYWAGCRPSDVCWLMLKNTAVGPKIGTITVGHKAGKMRTIDLRNEARAPLFDYITKGQRRFPKSEYVFTSKRAERLTENGLHRWFKRVKEWARKDEWEIIQDVTFHDLRHDFAHRAREAGWELEEIAVYLGHVTNKGTPAIQTTVRYTQPSQEKLRQILNNIKG